ncbi:MAG: hypothetical protein IKD76_06905 [Clostridia bacterium]|nr:hypothetical protein [Clostridia bacterium]
MNKWVSYAVAELITVEKNLEGSIQAKQQFNDVCYAIYHATSDVSKLSARDINPVNPKLNYDYWITLEGLYRADDEGAIHKFDTPFETYSSLLEILTYVKEAFNFPYFDFCTKCDGYERAVLKIRMTGALYKSTDLKGSLGFEFYNEHPECQ